MANTFRSFKTIKSIPVRSDAVRDALVHLTFDPSITAIDHFDELSFGDTCIRADAIFINIALRRYVLEVESATPIAQCVVDFVGRLGIDRRVISIEEVRRLPRYTNEQEIWRHTDRMVSVLLRMQIFSQVRKRGVLPIGELMKSLEGFDSAREALLSLACFGLLRIDLNAPLSSDTLVSLSI